MTVFLTLAQVLHLHHEVMLDHGQQAILIAPEKLESAVHRPATEAFGEALFSTLQEQAAALLHGLVSAHAFMDGNKRIGLTAMIAFLELNGVASIPAQDDLYDLTIAAATGELREVGDIAARVAELFDIR